MRATFTRVFWLAAAVFFALAAAGAEVDQSTPRRAMSGFLEAAHNGNFALASEYLDLRHFSQDERGDDGPVLAQDLAYVIDHRVPVDPEALPDAPESGDGRPIELGKVMLRDQTVSLQMDRVRGKDGVHRWFISRSTIALVPELDKLYGAARWQDRLPRWLRSPLVWGNAPWQWLGILVFLAGAFVIGRLLAAILVGLGASLAKRTASRADDLLLEAARRPLRLVLASLLLRGGIDILDLTPGSQLVVQRGAYTAMVVGVSWLVIALARVAAELFEDRLSDGPASAQLATRGLRTQLTVLRRVGSVIVVLVAGAVILLQFEFVRNVGVSLLASAGIVSLVVGLSAQKTLGGIIAGVQLSLAQPVRIGDAVTIENEFGEIEEIHLTYVVVKVWDGRRLIVPIQRMLEQPFINWTRVGEGLLGAVVIHVDHGMPLEPLRAELERVLAESPLWDKRVGTLIVLDTDARSVHLRALVSAATPGALWDLRCAVRERLVAFVRSYEGGRFLTRVRAEPLGAAVDT